MVSKIKQDPEQMRGFLKEFALQLTMTPVPPPGKVSVVSIGGDILVGDMLYT